MRKLPPPSSHAIQLTGTMFYYSNVLSKFHANWAKNVTMNVFTCFHYIHIEKNAPLTGGNVFSPIPTIFKFLRDINKTNVFTNFHDDWAKIPNRENCHYIHIEKNTPPTGGQVFSPISTIFELSVTRKTVPRTGGHVFQRIGTTFELKQDIIKTNILTYFELGQYFIGTKLLPNFIKMGQEMWPLECLRVNVTGRTDGRTYDGQRPVTKAHLSNQVS
ncbi:hypothetical protein DPMN_069004 [Dreissena polymorpha]|uniref:Uncharacterized protein n=1 Tax=Dreissena polymorpha TaxID=45954 RepID=A0A9D3Z2N7_DREPO|nr:hypothetical protein DPMN_069004 [Dreissena polymorpha]